MRIEHILISVAVFIAVFTLGIGMFAEQIDNYDYSGDTTTFVEILNSTGDYESHLQDMKDGTIGSGLEVGDDDSESSLYKTAVREVKEFGTSAEILFKATEVVGQKTGIFPKFIIDLFIGILIAMVVAFIIYMVMRFKPHNN